MKIFYSYKVLVEFGEYFIIFNILINYYKSAKLFK